MEMIAKNCLIQNSMFDVERSMLDDRFPHSCGSRYSMLKNLPSICTRSAAAGGTRSVASASLHPHLSSSLRSLRSLWLNKEAVNHRQSLLPQEAFA